MSKVKTHKVIGARSTRLAIIFFLFIILLSMQFGPYNQYQLANISTLLIAVLSITLLTGASGQISLGQGAIMAVGGYSSALLVTKLGLSMWIAFILAIFVSALFGLFLGLAAARLSGPYLAGTTLAFAVGLPSIANQFSILGGEQGISFDAGWPPLSFGESFTQYKWFLWIATLAALISMWWVQNVLRSRYGRGWRALKNNEVAAELAGINLGRSKVLAFTVSSGLAGLAGALLAMTMNNVSPSAFPLALSFFIATGAVLSGVNTLGGVIIGSVLLVVVPLIASSISDRWSGSENLANVLPDFIVSALLILTVFLAPKGPIEKIRSRHSK